MMTGNTFLFQSKSIEWGTHTYVLPLILFFEGHCRVCWMFLYCREFDIISRLFGFGKGGGDILGMWLIATCFPLIKSVYFYDIIMRVIWFIKINIKNESKVFSILVVSDWLVCQFSLKPYIFFAKGI